MSKDEAGGKQIVQYVGLKANLYSFKMLHGSDDKKCKSLTRNATKISIVFDDYRECLCSRKEQHRKMNVISSHCHQIYTEEINKIALSSDDGKRIIMADGINALAYSHTNLKNVIKMSYNDMPNILVDSVTLPNRPLSNLEIIDAAKKLSLKGFRGVFWRDLFLRKQNETNVVF